MNTVKVRNLELGSGIPAICIPNVGKTREEILSLAGQYKDMHMDLMEWRMDWYEDVEDTDKVLDVLSNLRSLLKDMPLLATFRTVKEGGVHGMSRKNTLHSTRQWLPRVMQTLLMWRYSQATRMSGT